MISKLTFYFNLLIFCLISYCQNAKEKVTKDTLKSSSNLTEKNVDSDTLDIEKDNEDELLIKILKKQVEKGKSALYSNSFDITTYTFDTQDFEVTLPFLKQKLDTYNVPSNVEFKKKIQEIFGRTIDYQSGSKYLYVNLNNKEDREKKYFRNDNSIEITPLGIFIVKESNFITPLYAIPEVVDYKIKYPQILEFERNIEREYKNEEGEQIKIYKWMDEVDIPSKTTKAFLARNKYLFNDDKSQLDWLLQNDEEFMESLVRTYSYWKDQKHKDWFDNRP